MKETLWLAGYFGLMAALIGIFVSKTRSEYGKLKVQDVEERLTSKVAPSRAALESRRVGELGK
jgi:hypothetical protein